MSKRVVIIGGGIIGLCSAYYLQKSGHKVIVLDKSDMNSGASYVNAGYLCPSHIIPLAAPGVMKKGIKWMFNSASPLYIKPRIETDFLKWAWAFNKSCNKNHVEKSIRIDNLLIQITPSLFFQIDQESVEFKVDHHHINRLKSDKAGLRQKPNRLKNRIPLLHQ